MKFMARIFAHIGHAIFPPAEIVEIDGRTFVSTPFYVREITSMVHREKPKAPPSP